MTKHLKCTVIGAGPGGIVAIKELLENGINDVLCLEKSDKLGGIFSKSYDNLVLTSSVTFSMFSDFWPGDGKDNSFWNKHEAVDYWTRYAKHFGVIDHIQFQTTVEKVTSDKDGQWELSLSTGEKIISEHLVLAIGNNRIPRFPEWSNQLSDIRFLHSSDYFNADDFHGKKVLVVGGGESAADIALEVSRVARKSWISLRGSSGWVVPRTRNGHAADISTHRGVWDLPRDYGTRLSKLILKLESERNDPVFDAVVTLNKRVQAPYGIWGIYGTKTLALPEAIACHGCKLVEEIVSVENGGTKLITKDGSTLDDVDVVIFATGYTNRVDFMPEELQACDPRSLYKHMFHPELKDKLAWIGWARPGFGSQFPIMEMQARLLAMVLSGKKQLPESTEMVQVAAMDKDKYIKQFEITAERIRSLVDYHRYMYDIAAMIGCYPPISRYFFTQPGLWIHIIYGPTQATQFRLHGPGSKPELAKDIMMKLPVSTFNYLVKAGLKGRILYSLRRLNPRYLFE